MKTYHIHRTRVFASITEALASGKLFQNGETIRIKGDHTRFKIGTGTDYTGLTPSTKSGKTFLNLPWIQIPGSPTNAAAINATATITAAQLATKYLTSTSAAAVTATLPTAVLFAAALGITTNTLTWGYAHDWVFDNSNGASTVTVAVGAGITVIAPIITGGGTLTIAAGTIGYFRITFKNSTTAFLYRLA